MSYKQARRGIAAVVGTAAGAFLAAGLIPLVTSPVAGACSSDDPTCGDPDFIDHTTHFGPITDVAAADPDDHEFDAMLLQGPLMNGSPLFTDVLTSGKDPEDSLALLGAPDLTGVGTAGETVNTLIVPDLHIDSVFTIPFTDPLAEIWTALVPLGF